MNNISKVKAVILAAAIMLSLAACSTQQPENNSSEQPVNNNEQKKNDSETIYQVALLQSLTQGYYDGIIKVSELKEHGDIGIGTFEGVNGEMIVLDGKVYQALGDGTVQEADENETVPFSNVTFFDSDVSVKLKDIKDMGSVIKLLFNGKPVPIDKKTDNSRMNHLTFRETDSFTCKSFDSSPKCQMITFYLLCIFLSGF